MSVAETVGSIGLVLLTLVVIIRLLVPSRKIIGPILVLSAITLLVLAYFNFLYLKLFTSRYGIMAYATLPFFTLIIGSKKIAGIEPGTLYLDYTWIVAVYMLIELHILNHKEEQNL